ncbi:Zinc finger CW-type PWWP domain protein 2 [Holothuria leucospilota]|uniref:Zinc finger CW-type PWWP domain protein 2 n=1 Tax=Holothuria leucospilota TaxID=206669 RepID=A0A9Q0YLU1_HOLLE|nr:Zinc finger CW-type PWWP domain protein 2 [Holothuria leucospilota]
MSTCSSRRSCRRSRRNSQLNHDCGSCQEATPTPKISGLDFKKLRSGRTIETPPSSQEQAEDKTDDIHDVLQGLTFIQCESESCLKWRKITQEEADSYQDKQWFCHLNKNDPDHCRCDQPEEDQQVQLAESSGYRYTFSTLPCGTLVWAKMTGHVAWPSIISQDPDSKECFWKDGVTEFYHVEFLGKRHYHCWISPLFLDPYGDGRKPEFPNTSDKKGIKRKHHGKKKALTLSRTDKVVKSKSYQKSFESAVEEAESLRGLTNEERHLKCVYIPKELKLKKCDKKVEKVEAVKKIEVALRPQRKRRNQPALPEVTPKNVGNVSNIRPHKQRKQAAIVKKTSPKPINKSKCKKTLFSSDKDKKYISQVLLKEEKLFNGAWAHFMKSRGLVFDRKLSFNGSSLSAFRLFMSVQERGGYKEISSSPSDWAAIVREITGKSQAGKCKSTLLKKLFRRNLLPYEKHLLSDSKNIKNDNKTVPLNAEPAQTKLKAEISVPTSGQYVHPPPEIKTAMTATPFVTGGYTCGPSSYPSHYSSSGTCQPMNSIILPSSTSAATLTPSNMNYYGVSGGMLPPVTAPPNTYIRTLPMERNGDTDMFRKLDSQKGGKLFGKPLAAPQSLKGIPQSHRNGWYLDPVDFQKDILEIDNIIQDLDKTQYFDSSTQGKYETQRDSGRPVLEFYSMQYDDLDTVLKEQRKKSNSIDDVQRVPEGLAPPPSYIIPEKIPPPYLSTANQRSASQVDDLVQEVSRLDAVLQMEFSHL